MKALFHKAFTAYPNIFRLLEEGGTLNANH